MWETSAGSREGQSLRKEGATKELRHWMRTRKDLQESQAPPVTPSLIFFFLGAEKPRPRQLGKVVHNILPITILCSFHAGEAQAHGFSPPTFL